MNLAHLSLSTLTSSHNPQYPTTPSEKSATNVQYNSLHLTTETNASKNKTSKWHQAPRVFGTHLMGPHLSPDGHHQAIIISPLWYPWDS